VHKVSVFYPSGEDTSFDMDYYRTKHRQICFEHLEGLERLEIDQVVDGPYLAVGHLYFPSLEALQGAMGSPTVAETAADIPNFTNTTPVIQISEVID
jgi:uncharacterized protein (TIGR02118 family)